MKNGEEGSDNTIKANNIDENTVQSTYDTSRGKFIVNSHFSGDIELSELIYQIIIKNADSRPPYT